MALRLKGSSSGYAEIDASADAGSVTLTLPATAGTINVKDASGNTNVGTGVNLGNPGPNIFTINTNGSERFRIAADGGVSIPGVLTYEDVTSVDAIGLSTFRDGLITKDVGIATITSSDVNGATAVDVFVYDTSKDSDGGAWRKRTSHTSWYNEEAAAGVRGSRKEFPAVAVIVAEADKVTIYDGDDPDLPLWMVFNVSNNTWLKLYSSAAQCSCITALNGILCAGGNGTGIRLAVVDFIKDNQYLTEAGFTYYNNGIETRNDTTTFPNDGGSKSIVNNAVNDVAMTVLPNAPIDDATGLPVPTIAVATDGGVSVIKDDGTVVDITSSKAVNDVDLIHFDKSGRLYFAAQASSSVTDVYQFNRYVIPSSDISNNVYEDNADATYFSYASSGSFANVRPNFNAQYNNGTNEDITNIVSNNDGGIVGNVNGLSLFVEDYESQNNGMVAYAATSYNTGYMVGDIKGAFLTDTDITNATDSQKVNWNNGSDVSGDHGGANAASVTIVSNTSITITADASDYTYYNVGYTPVAGKRYVGVLTGSNYSGSGPYGLSLGGGGGFSINMRTSAPGTVGPEVITSSGSAFNIFVANGLTVTVTLTIYELVEEDRSVNKNGLQVNGTITKSVVATGAELVSYNFSGSASNYLRQPYNSNLDFGTGDFSVVYWFNQTEHATHQDVINRSDAGQNDGSWLIQHNTDGTILFYIRSGGSYTSIFSGGGSITNSGWTQVVISRSGTALKQYHNGVEVEDGSSSLSLTLNGAELQISTRVAVDAYPILAGNSIALARISASAPSPEQIKKMYDDEKFLFQENAKATLHGSSDAVTALAYDEVTDQLHVGTSSGRSNFQGLRRINNTTDPVTTAISAHDTFIIEQ